MAICLPDPPASQKLRHAQRSVGATLPTGRINDLMPGTRLFGHTVGDQLPSVQQHAITTEIERNFVRSLARLFQAVAWHGNAGLRVLGIDIRFQRGLSASFVSVSRRGEARRILAPVYDRFTEGFATTHLCAGLPVRSRSGEGRSLCRTRDRLSVALSRD
jgi:hypothetical protein